MKSIFACGCLALAAGAAAAQNGVAHGTIFGDVGPRSAAWVENTTNNFLYHDGGSGTRKFILNETGTVAGANSYLTVNADVSGFFGMAVHSPDDTAIPYYGYVLNNNLTGKICTHSYNPNSSRWSLSIEGDVSLYVDENRDVQVPLGGVVASDYQLNAARYLFGWVSKYETPYFTFGGYSYYKVSIPDGATVYQFQSTVIDTSSTENITVELVRFTNNLSMSSLAYLATSGAPGGVTPSTASISNQIVDNAMYVYYVRVNSPLAGDGTEFLTARYQYYINEI